MKILPLVVNTSKSIKETTVRVSKAGKNGYDIGLRTSKIYKKGDTATLLNISRCVGRKLKQETTIDDLPIVAGAIGMLIPLPLASPALLALGKVVQVVAKRMKNFRHAK